MASIVNLSEGPQSSSIHRFGLPRLRSNRTLSSSADSVVFVNTLAEEDEDSEEEDGDKDSLVENIEVGRVAGWCVSFDRVLADPLGVQCFHMFLKGEHSDENILFWKEVEEFKNIANSTNLRTAAEKIYTRFISTSASQQINIEHWVLKDVEDNMNSPTAQLFEKAQKEIYQLMKLDCYLRFVRSQIVKDCLCAEMAGKPLPIKTPTIRPAK